MLFLGCNCGAAHLLVMGHWFGNIWISGSLRKNNGSTVPGQLIVLCQHCSPGTIVLKLDKLLGVGGKIRVLEGIQ